MKSFNYTITDEVEFMHVLQERLQKGKGICINSCDRERREERTGTETDGSYEPRCEKKARLLQLP